MISKALNPKPMLESFQGPPLCISVKHPYNNPARFGVTLTVI